MNFQLQAMLQQAIQAFQSGNFDSADLILKRVLVVDSKNLPALHILGLIKASQSNFKEAADYLARAARIHPDDASIQYNLAKALTDFGNNKDALVHHKKAVALAPNNPEAWLNYGKTASNLGRYEDALSCNSKALDLRSDYVEAWFNQGATLHALGRYEEAITHYDKVVSLKPDYIEAWFNKGADLYALGRYEEAIAQYDQALNLKPDYHEAWSNKGVALHALGRYEEAIAQYDQALNLKPDYHEAWTNKGIALNELGRYEEAIAQYDQALNLKPDYHEALFNKGVVLNQLQNYEEAIAQYDQALNLKPDYHEAWSNKGATLQALKCYDEAIASFDKALNIRSDYHEAWFNKGATLNEIKHYEEALDCYEKAVHLKPDYQEAWTNKSLVNLFLKNYKVGWDNFDWRLIAKDVSLKKTIEGLKTWNGSGCKNLLVFTEQGIGDIIFYASILEAVKSRVENMTVTTDLRLIPILSRSFPNISFVDHNAPLNNNLYDAQIQLASLPVVIGMTPDTVGRSAPYLISNNELTSVLQNKTSPNKQLKCGIAWKSSNKKIGKDKSILLSDLNEILQVDGFEFINLQYGDTQKEIEDLEKNYGAKLTTIDGIDLFNDIDGLLSIIQTCDLIVTTSNVTAHLAGALGKTTLLLVPYSAGRIWYWHDEAISSWYPSITLYSQNQNFEWNGAIKDIASRLKNGISK